jgi:hypothetical protein
VNSKTVSIYVEGKSDVAAMEQLLRPLIERKNIQGVKMNFFETPDGDRKQSLMTKAPHKAVQLLRDPHHIVVVMPDLYPYNKHTPHQTVEALEAAIQKEFKGALKSKNLDNRTDYEDRFKVFCYKHDLEALILAATDALALRLGVEAVKVTWKLPVEDQNNTHPPKKVVKALFEKYGQNYIETVDAPLILGLTDYHDLVDACPQCFKPFIDFLEQV